MIANEKCRDFCGIFWLVLQVSKLYNGRTDMTFYEKLGIGKYLGHTVSVVLHDGRGYMGRLCDGLTNEDWKEDGELEALALEIHGYSNLTEIDLCKIRSIAKVSEITTLSEAV